MKSFFSLKRNEKIYSPSKCPTCGTKAYGEHDNSEGVGGLCLACGYCWDKNEGSLNPGDLIYLRNTFGYIGPDKY